VTESSPRRYLNLIRHIRNWTAYFGQKSSGFQPASYVTRGNNLRFDVPTKGLYLVFKEIFMTDFYNVDTWIGKLPQNPVVVDVGANAGYFNMLLLAKRPDAKVYAYEAIEANYQLFRKNIEQNPSLKEHIQLHHQAVTGQPVDHIVLYKEDDGDNSVTASVYQDFEQHNCQSVTVPAVSLANLMEKNNLRQVDFLKLDCEGSEYPILYDSPASLWPRIHSMFVEVHPLDKEKRNFDYLKGFLEQYGYSVKSAEVANNGCYALYAVRH